MRDSDIREAVRVRLAEIHADEPGTLFRNELGLCLGETRVDVVAINGQISGYEIKSARDTLARLPTQRDLYNRVLDYATVVAEGRHMDRVRQIVPRWWGLWQAVDDGARVAIRELRPPRVNRKHLDRLSLAQLLWRDEALAVLATRGRDGGLRRATRWEIWDRLATLPLAQLQEEVRHRLKARPAWPGG
jgi:hypothetical protein